MWGRKEGESVKNHFITTANFFTKYDEELATTFSVYCGISLHQVRTNTTTT